MVEQQLAALEAGRPPPFSVVELLISDGSEEARAVAEPQRLARLGDILRDRKEALRVV